MAIVQTPKRRMPIVLITRPFGQHTDFAAQSHDLGFSTVLLPCLEIHHLHTSTLSLRQQIDTCDVALFTSANAVRHAHRILPLPWSDIDLHAIGSATARTLYDFGQNVSLMPTAPFTSEGYLTQLEQQVPDSLLIIKGRGGRTLIQDVLKKQGVSVKSTEIYERRKPSVEPEILNDIFTDPPDIVCVTSDEILNNLTQLCASHLQLLTNIPLVVNSQRCAGLAVELGFNPASIMLAQPAGDIGQLDCLREWLRRTKR